MAPPPSRRAEHADQRMYALDVRELAGPVQNVSACPACGATRAEPRFEVDGVAARVVACVECGLGRFHPMLGADEIRAFYPDEYYGEPGEKFQPTVERVVRDRKSVV